MLEIDGSAGGGQLLRTALTLSCLETTPFRITSIRGSRPNSGLKPQHLACVEAAAALSAADVEGADVGSDELRFEPTAPPGGDVAVDVGTAGSVTLVFETLLPLAAVLDAPVSATVRGGTDVRWAPSLAWYRRVKLPLLARHGLAADVSLRRRGFYPVGGGEATLRLAPSTFAPLSLTRRGDVVVSVHAVAARELADAEVCERALERVRASLSSVPVVETTATYADTDCPGFALSVSLAGAARAGFDAYGERGRPAEDVAEEACERVTAWLAGDGVVDAHLGDQLSLVLALAGGEVRIPAVTDHVRTNLAVLSAFGYDVELVDETASALLVVS